MGLVMDLEMLKTLLDQQAKLSGRKPEWKKGIFRRPGEGKGYEPGGGGGDGNKTYGLSDHSMETIRKPMERERPDRNR